MVLFLDGTSTRLSCKSVLTWTSTICNLHPYQHTYNCTGMHHAHLHFHICQHCTCNQNMIGLFIYFIQPVPSSKFVERTPQKGWLHHSNILSTASLVRMGCRLELRRQVYEQIRLDDVRHDIGGQTLWSWGVINTAC